MLDSCVAMNNKKPKSRNPSLVTKSSFLLNLETNVLFSFNDQDFIASGTVEIVSN